MVIISFFSKLKIFVLITIKYFLKLSIMLTLLDMNTHCKLPFIRDCFIFVWKMPLLFPILRNNKSNAKDTRQVNMRGK